MHESYGIVWLTWKPRMIEYLVGSNPCCMKAPTKIVSGLERLSMVKFFSMTFTGLTDVFTWRRWNRCFVLFVQQFSSKRVINFESWCFGVLPYLYEKMKCSNNLGEGSKSVVPELVALKFMILWKHPTCWKYYPDYAQCTHRDTPETLWWHWFWLNPPFRCRAEVPQITEHSQVPATCPKDIIASLYTTSPWPYLNMETCNVVFFPGVHLCLLCPFAEKKNDDCWHRWFGAAGKSRAKSRTSWSKGRFDSVF